MMQDKPKTISENEWRIILMLRSLQPYETIQIVADKSGRPGFFLVVRSTKVMLTVEEPKFVP